jgi:putative oxidoreductase
MASQTLSSSSWNDRGLLLLRVALGLVFVMHGWQKLTVFGIGGVAGMFGQMGMPLPTVNAAAIIAVELLGGLALIVGGGTRIAAGLAAFSMGVATVLVHLANGFFMPTGYEFTLTLLLASAALVMTGAGRYSIDALLRADARRSHGRSLELAA